MVHQAEFFRASAVPSSPPTLTVLDTRLRGTRFVEHGVTTIVNTPESTGMGFWSINPFVGCEFGCSYCYARYAHRFVVERARDRGVLQGDEFDEYRGPNGWEAFEERIFVKSKAEVLAALERDLLRVLRRRGEAAQRVVIGTATDPYQPAERRFGITRAVLERLTTVRNLSLGLITKSRLVSRDIDVLQSLGRSNRLTVYISLISTDPHVIRTFEARSPLPHARFQTLEKLRQAGISAGIIVAPVLPGITDSVFQIDAVMRAAKQAGAAFVHPSVLRLYSSVLQRFMPVLERHFPNLAPRYRAVYRGNRDAPDAYVSAVERRFARLARKYGIGASDPMALDDAGRPPASHVPETQLSLL